VRPLLLVETPAAENAGGNDGAVRQVSPEDGEWVQPGWSPDGKMLAAAWGPSGHTRIRLFPMNGGAAVDLAPEYTAAEWPAWSPDGKTIAFASPVRVSHQVYAVDVGTGRVRLVSDGVHTSSHHSWKPDGALAFNCNCGLGTQVMLREPGGAIRALTNALLRNIFPSFSKDGSRLVFVSERDGNSEIYDIYN
jgi:TolB protein